MRNAHGMQILDTVQDLPERAFHFPDTHVALLDGCVEISTRTVLHDFTPVMLFVLNEINSFYHVGVMQG